MMRSWWPFRKKKAAPLKEAPLILKDETYWNEKHPFIEQMYSGRPLPNGRPYSMDVRRYIWPNDLSLRRVVEQHRLCCDNNDDTAGKVQRYVCDFMKYVADTLIGSAEYWLFPAESLAMRQGDCEDGAILMASLLLNALPIEHHWRVRVSAGDVQIPGTSKTGGHAYVTFCRCTDNEWVILDWCYYPDSSLRVQQKPLAKDKSEYQKVWFSFNHHHAWSHLDFALGGRLRDALLHS